MDFHVPLKVIRPDERFRTMGTFVGFLIGMYPIVDANRLLMGEHSFAGSAHKLPVVGTDAIFLLVWGFPLLWRFEQ